jgi:rubrerythrin
MPSTLTNLENAFAIESMAFSKYAYFAKICRLLGDVDTARHFETAAKQEMQHAQNHLELLYPLETLSVVHCLELAVADETYEYAEMYPKFRAVALSEGKVDALAELDAQIAESLVHAEHFQALLLKIAKRFEALARIERKHAERHATQLRKVNGEV